MVSYLDFEKPIADLESRVRELRTAGEAGGADIAEEVERLEAKAQVLLHQTYARLTAWQKTLVARHPERPHFEDYVDRLIEDFTPLAGDRSFGEDPAIIGGIGRFRGRSVMAIGHEKGRGTEGRIAHNFGMAKPEGYRKAVRLMEMADRFHLPVITLVDTTGAYPGVSAEERGQAEAIARSIDACLAVGVPLISVIVGEGGSGGAVALAAGNRIVMMEHSVYSVISPEGCAAILWNDSDKAKEAAEALRLTASDLLRLKVIDEVVPEPPGGAHRNPQVAIDAVGDSIDRHLRLIGDAQAAALREGRRRKFLDMGRIL